jgi:hypothetical protein
MSGTSYVPGTCLALRRSQGEVGALLEARRLDPLNQLTHSDFLFAVRDWIASRAGALI